jgi:hypothetical protein
MIIFASAVADVTEGSPKLPAKVSIFAFAYFKSRMKSDAPGAEYF